MEKANLPSSVQAGVTVTKPWREMELSLDVNRIPRGRRNPKMEKETDQQVEVMQILKYQEKVKGKSCSVQPCNGAGTDLVQPVNSERARKSQHESVKAPKLRTEEVVRYMSNVPGFLQRMEKGENIQGKALNVGVLDWRRLEKLKGSQRFGAQSEGNGRMPASGLHRFTRSHDFESTSKGSLDGQKIRGWNHKPFDKKVPSKVGSSSLESGSSEGQVRLRENSIAFSGDAKRHQAGKTSGVKLVADRRSSRSFMSSSSELKGCDISLVPKDRNMGHNKVRNKPEEASRSSTTIVSPEGEVKHGEKVVLLVPTKRSQSSFSEEPRALPSGSGKIADLNGISDNPRSFPLPPRLDTSKLVHSDSMMATKGGELWSTVPPAESSSTKHISNRSLDNFKFARDYDSGTQTVSDIDQTIMKDTHPSPIRGFPFSLARLTRSFSSKESSTIPPLSSVYESIKSGPVTSQSYAGLSIPTEEMTSGPSRAKSSPLRRLLDPLFKSKVSKSMKETANSSDLEQTNDSESIQHDKHEEASIQAVLHVAVRNGLPVFKFLVDKVDGKASILAATKNVSSPRKSNSGCSYTFYAIDEIKKRSNRWISRGYKDERCEYTYNVIGQMNVNHSPFLGLTGENLTGHETFSEYVLFGLELGGKLGATSPPKLRPSRELGAVIVRTHSVNIGTQKQVDSARNEQSISVTAILPAAVHGLPEKGGPWPLIQRWRSGGSCDCGGWDVGCGLCVLSAAVQVASNGFQLFAEGGGSKEGKPVFVMRPAEKGMYSIEFKRRISLVQAFFIAVTVIHSQKPSDLVDLTMEKVFLEPDEPVRKMSARASGAATKFAPSPPLSPVGRI